MDQVVMIQGGGYGQSSNGTGGYGSAGAGQGGDRGHGEGSPDGRQGGETNTSLQGLLTILTWLISNLQGRLEYLNNGINNSSSLEFYSLLLVEIEDFRIQNTLPNIDHRDNSLIDSILLDLEFILNDVESVVNNYSNP